MASPARLASFPQPLIHVCPPPSLNLSYTSSLLPSTSHTRLNLSYTSPLLLPSTSHTHLNLSYTSSLLLLSTSHTRLLSLSPALHHVLPPFLNFS
ncbi:hypothetical protein Pmani_035515 [Petrolisthes manimaculis]|uniref:Uncharacterized protein n=1 Tax=Petrolisthes manimaculis TaxID=1843537 RepID=A0AAE1TQG6_9EUCA|nr:hypothetical protein Pmani_035515 [Petrolisthes manimaculis]